MVSQGLFYWERSEQYALILEKNMERSKNKETEPKPTATIIGGEGAMGKLMVKLFRSLGFNTLVWDIKDPNLPDIRTAVTASKIIFFSVPPDQIPKILTTIEDLVNETHIILDNSSVKAPFAEKFKELDQKGISICSTHPLFRPEVQPKGEKVLLMKVGASSQKAFELATKLFEKAQIEIIPFSFEQHDLKMAAIQGFPHFIMRLSAATLAKSGFDFEQAGKIATPNFDLFDASLWRTNDQAEEISTQLISSMMQTEAGQLLIQNLTANLSLMLDLVNGNNLPELAQIFERSVNTLDRNDKRNQMRKVTSDLVEARKRLPEN